MRPRYYDPEWGEEIDPITDDSQWPAESTVTVSGYGGVAWAVRHVSPLNGRVVCVMIGDDRYFEFEPTELTLLPREAYCAECGQIGCTWDGLERELRL